MVLGRVERWFERFRRNGDAAAAVRRFGPRHRGGRGRRDSRCALEAEATS